MQKLFLILGLIVFIGTSCSSPDPYPRPKGWPRIDLPAHTYQVWENEDCPFSFELPTIGKVEMEKPDSCFLDFYFKEFECRWHVTYRHIPSSGRTFNDHSEEYRKLVYKHVQQAQIQTSIIEGKNGSGTFYELYGNIGVPAKLNYGDSTHMIMTSFYFDTAVNSDSLAPVIQFMKEDLMHMVSTIRWKE